MKAKLLLSLLCCLALAPVFSQGADQSASDFAKYAIKLREESLRKMEPQVSVPTTGRTRGDAGTRILMIGDSMSVGTFGESLANYFISRFGRSNVALYASCGSSPQSWLSSEPDFITKCGFRIATPTRNAVIDFQKGHRPPRVRTPKIENLLAEHRPTTLVVQMGTNWMDGLSSRSSGDSAARDSEIIDRFIAAVRKAGGVRQIIWIAPPDSSHFSGRVQRTVESIIDSAARRHGFDVIHSSAMTHYTPGRSGGDGIHYNSEPAEAWAVMAERELTRKIR